MANQMLRAFPHVGIPGLVVPNVQDVPFKEYIGHTTNFGTLAEMTAYFTTVNNINSETQVSQSWATKTPRQSYTLGQIQAPYYSIDAYVEYNVDEQAKFEAVSNGVSLPAFLENLAKQGINQRRHLAVLHGFDSTASKQGILGNATTVTMPADSNTKSKVTEYNVAELAQFLANTARSVMDATYGMAKPVVIASTPRVINYLSTAIVPLASNQKDGAGVESVAGTYGKVVGTWLGVGNIKFISDATLVNGNKDVIVFVAPGIDTNSVESEDSQNLVGQFNSVNYNTWVDSALGLMRSPAPEIMGTFATKYTFKTTPGVTIRPEAVVKCEVTYA